MRNFTKLFALAIVMIGLSSTTSFAQDDATATASATIITPITITKNVDMNFGNIAVQAGTGGTAVLATDNSRTRTSGVTLPTFSTGSPTAASFTVEGEENYTYAITLPTTVTILNGVNEMDVDTFTSDPDATGVLTLGTQTLKVGATLHVAAGQAPGTYTNTTDLTVTVNYN